jgi:hypothetical protein
MGWTRWRPNVFQKEKVVGKDAKFFKMYLDFTDFTVKFLYYFFSFCGFTIGIAGTILGFVNWYKKTSIIRLREKDDFSASSGALFLFSLR